MSGTRGPDGIAEDVVRCADLTEVWRDLVEEPLSMQLGGVVVLRVWTGVESAEGDDPAVSIGMDMRSEVIGGMDADSRRGPLRRALQPDRARGGWS